MYILKITVLRYNIIKQFYYKTQNQFIAFPLLILVFSCIVAPSNVAHGVMVHVSILEILKEPVRHKAGFENVEHEKDSPWHKSASNIKPGPIGS